MDIELLKRLVKQGVIFGAIGWFGLDIAEKAGLGFWQGLILIFGAVIAWDYRQLKAGEKEIQAQFAQAVEAEVERRSREKQPG